MQILQRVGHSKAGAQIEMKLGVADGRKIHQNHIAVRLLQSYGGIDRGCSGSRPALGTEKSEDASFARASTSASAVGTETCQGFEKGFGASAVIQVFAGPGAHAGHNRGGLLHAAVGENRQLQGIGLNEFDRADGRLRILRRDIDDDDFGAQILNLAEDGVSGAGRKADIAEHGPGQTGSLYPALQFR